MIESLDRGAVENWLISAVARAATLRPEIEWSFFSTLTGPGRLDEIARRFGWKVLTSRVPLRKTAAFLVGMRRALAQGGFDVLHCHHDYLSGLYLAASWGLQIRRRIVHVHNTDAALPTRSRLKAALLKEPLRRICLRADRVVGISPHVLEMFVGSRGPRPGRDSVLYYGVDLERFVVGDAVVDAARRELGLAASAKILLFVGRMTELKNPCFALDVFARVARVESNAVAVFAGSGPLEAVVRERARSLGLESRVHVLGWRDDTAALMRAADLLIFPRLEQPKEGLGLVVVEAQAAGLPTLTSFGVLDDAIVSPALVRREALSSGLEVWSQAALTMLRERRDPAPVRSAAVEGSRFSMDRSARDLLLLYE